MAWLQAHAALLAAFAVALIEFLIGLIPNLKNNSIIGLVLAALQKLVGGSSTPPSV